MNKFPITSRRRGFTLIELLTVIAIIGILAGILIPAIGNVRKKASQAKSMSNLKQIALAYNNFSTAGSRTRTIKSGTYNSSSATDQAGDMKDWALVLAQGAELIDAAVYIIDGDPELSDFTGTMPKTIGSRQSDGSFSANADWTAFPDENIAYAAVVGMSSNANGSTTPLIWTKGLQATGFWDPAENPWGNDGGHIAYMDGHVEFFDNVAEPEPQLVANTQSASAGDATVDIQQAILSSSSAEIVDPSGTL